MFKNSLLSFLRKKLGTGSFLPVYHAAFGQEEGVWQVNDTIFPTSINIAGFVLTWGVEAS